ncbi:hypothetical protein JHK87_004627 [Glycine soja]|nr:hypothetical protein JHK87_004627 [Glycine soja]
MIRLHFCELDPNINEISDKVFFIYIESQLVDDCADVMRWTQNWKVLAVYKHYAILVPQNNTQKKKQYMEEHDKKLGD